MLPRSISISLTLVCIVSFPLALLAQTTRRPLITESVNNTRFHTLAGNTRPEANGQNDLGAVSSDLVLDHMELQLQRSAAQETALQQYIDQLHNPKSPQFHKWLTAEQFGEMFGSTQQDVNTITSWLQSQGFTVNSVSPGRMTVDFSGNAGQVLQAFHTSIHNLNVNGKRHIANMSDPQIPAALAPAVSGIVSLHDFSPHSMKKARPAYTYTDQGQAVYAVTPADLATIYNLTPVFGAGYTGAGQTIAVIEDSNLYSSADWDTFRSTFGLTQYASGSLTTVHPAPAGGGSNCSNPGVPSGGDDGEAILDAEWSSAAAPGAAIEVASCADTRTTFGGLIAVQNLIGSANPPNVISISYGECEAENGAAANAAFSAAFQQATAQGISVFAAAGDEGAASCDANATGATHGIGVSGWASTPYNVAVGGTDFGDAYEGSTSTYWNSTNTSTYGSALSYVPEIPWDDSCASSLLSSSLGYSTPYGANGLCASNVARQEGLVQVAAGSGGPSGCATGSPNSEGIVSGTCQGYAKPSWQSLSGVPNDGVRDVPDVSLFAGTGLWGHYYVICWSDIRQGGASCSGDPSTWAGAGGTSFATPIMAGIQALVNQKTGSAQGNPNYVYYQLAATGSCNAVSGDPGVSSCVFHNVTQGDISVDCSGTQNCFGETASTTGGGFGGRRGGGGGGQPSDNGALSTTDQSFLPAFGAVGGWNFANGIGSVNAFNLVNAWPTGQ
jgi:subtilase family serine protease